MALRESGLLEISHHGVLIACHVRRQAPGKTASVHPLRPRSPRARPETVGRPVLRTVDPQGNISFAGMGYPVGRRHRAPASRCASSGNIVQISLAGRILRTHAARHDPEKLHGAFAIAKGRPRSHDGAQKGELSNVAIAE